MDIADIHIGDEVRFLDSIGGGRVARIDTARRVVYVEDKDGFEIPTPLSQVVVERFSQRSNTQPQQTNITPQQDKSTKETAPQDADTKHLADLKAHFMPTSSDMKTKVQGTAIVVTAAERRAKGKKEPHKEEILEVDLHISALTDKWQTMERSEMLNYQMNIFRRTMRENMRYKGKKIVFIHGRGEGVLKAAIYSELQRQYATCEYQDASFAQYGFGATMVIIK